jgi:hypothetical protein
MALAACLRGSSARPKGTATQHTPCAPPAAHPLRRPPPPKKQHHYTITPSHHQVSEEVSDDGKAQRLWEISEKLVGIKA